VVGRSLPERAALAVPTARADDRRVADVHVRVALTRSEDDIVSRCELSQELESWSRDGGGEKTSNETCELARTRCQRVVPRPAEVASPPPPPRTLSSSSISCLVMGSIHGLDHRVLGAEQKIALLTQEIRDMKTERNALTPLNRLPDELL
jgi:hypothetical protein